MSMVTEYVHVSQGTKWGRGYVLGERLAPQLMDVCIRTYLYSYIYQLPAVVYCGVCTAYSAYYKALRKWEEERCVNTLDRIRTWRQNCYRDL